jgi:uncharacterized protein YkwD
MAVESRNGVRQALQALAASKTQAAEARKEAHHRQAALSDAAANRSRRAHPAELRTARWFTLVFFVVTILVAPQMTVHAQQSVGSAERALFDAANRERVAQGLQPLHWDDALANAAREHAIRMAQRNTLSHQFPGEMALQDRARQAGARYTVIAENVAEGPSAETIHSSWMHSPHHRANLLDPDLTAIGISVILSTDNSGRGMLFAVQDFSQSVANLNVQQQERQVSAQLAARGLHVTSGAEAARKTCVMDRNAWAGPTPSLMMKYEASDLRELPAQLDQKIQSGKYRAAAVGACQPPSSGSFTHFRVAVLLY